MSQKRPWIQYKCYVVWLLIFFKSFRQHCGNVPYTLYYCNNAVIITFGVYCELKLQSDVQGMLPQRCKFDVVRTKLRKRCEFDVAILTLQRRGQCNIHGTL